MVKYMKTKADVPFKGTSSIKYNNNCIYNKILFNVVGNDLVVSFMRFNERKPRVEPIILSNFKQTTVTDILSQYPEMGRHFEDGIFEIWKFFGLNFGYTTKIIR